MGFHKAFLNSLRTSAPSEKSIFISKYSLKLLSNSREVTENLPYIQAYSANQVLCPFHYEISKLDSYSLIYTQKGSGLLTIDNRSYPLDVGTITFIDCNRYHRIEIKQSPWTYIVFFISGSPVSYFYSRFVENNGNVYNFLPDSSIPDKIIFLCDYLAKSPRNALIQIKYINDILFELLLEKNRSNGINTSMRDYIYEIKYDFDNHFTDNITLELLEQKYHISKYHICREFVKHFHISPIKYLNRRKIDAAKEILRYTDKKINEIGRMVGFENPNNLIRQFKKQTGVTPLVYRNQSQASSMGKKRLPTDNTGYETAD